MKVAYILGSLNRGGAETLLLDVFRHASSAAFEFIGIHRKDGPYLDEFKATGVPFLSCPRKGRSAFSYLMSLRKLLKQNGVTVAHTQLYLDAIYVRLATIGTDIKIVTTFHGFDTDKSLLGKCMYQLAMWMADKIVFVSETQRADYVSKYKCIEKKSSVVYNGVDFTKLEGAEKEEDPFTKIDRAKRGLQEKISIRLAMVGNFGSVRSQSIIARSIRLLKEWGIQNFQFYFVGRKVAGEEWRYEDCEQYCKETGLDNVHFLGGRGDVPLLLRHLDGFVYSTSHDTFGIAVVEAMASGIPVIVNDYPTMQEVTQNGKWAELYKTGDAESCAKKICDVINNLEKYKVKANRIAEDVREEFSIGKHIVNLNQVYYDL